MSYLFVILFILSLVYLIITIRKPDAPRVLFGRVMTKQLVTRFFVFTVLCLGVAILLVTPPAKTQVLVPAVQEQGSGYGETEFDDLVPHESAGRTYKVGDEGAVSGDHRYEVARVIDGDTIEVLIDGDIQTVRYIGVNTPETVHPSKPVECFGLEASNKNKALVADKQVRLVADVSDTDRYGRLLRYVYVDDLFVNEELVRQGYAHAASYPPDVMFNELFRAAETEARTNKRGLWGDVCAGVVVTSPTQPVSDPSAASGAGQCTIKGNINSEDEKIYHVVGCQSYNKTIIDESKGEQWFCSEAEALEAGWRKALNC